MIGFIIILHKSRSAAAVAGASSPCDSLLLDTSAAAATLLGLLETSTAASAGTALSLVLSPLLVALR